MKISVLKWVVINLVIWGFEINNVAAQIPPPELTFEDKVLPKSKFNKESKEKGYELVSITSESCNPNEHADVLSRLQQRITSLVIKEDTLLIQLSVIDQCCSYFSGEIAIKDDSIHLIYTIDGMPCQCICCYGLEYQIILNDPEFDIEKTAFLLNQKPISLSQEKYKTYPIQYKVFMNDTINLVDKYGMRQGYWLQKDSLSRIILEGFYQNDKDQYYGGAFTGFTGRSNIFYFENSRSIQRETFRKGHNFLVSRNYYVSGNLQKECLFNHITDNFQCKGWTDSGDVIKKEK